MRFKTSQLIFVIVPSCHPLLTAHPLQLVSPGCCEDESTAGCHQGADRLHCFGMYHCFYFVQLYSFLVMADSQGHLRDFKKYFEWISPYLCSLKLLSAAFGTTQTEFGNWQLTPTDGGITQQTLPCPNQLDHTSYLLTAFSHMKQQGCELMHFDWSLTHRRGKNMVTVSAK